MKNVFTTTIMLLFIVTSLFAQERNCGSMEYLEQQILENPARQQQLDDLEIFTREFIQSEAREVSGGILSIPVIVHVLYQNSTENISNAQIQSQIDVLTDDFRRMNSDASNTPSDFTGVAADTEIEFCLVQTIRVPTSVGSFGTNDSMKFSSSGGSDVVNPSSAMNMWVCEIGGGILGYAQFPGGSASTDGIVIDYRYFGTTGTATAPFNLGRTATHEVGHYLNLRHIWGDGGCNVDDFVSDTPKAGSPNYTGSPCTYPGPNTCTPKGRPGQPDDYDMFQNYMDYSDDACMNLFTTGQKDRMWAAINSSRPGLLTGACDGTPPPAVEICDNGIDDDGDGDIDCDDTDCSSHVACAPPGSCDAPTNLQHSRRKGGREATLSWNATTGASSYDVEVYNSAGTLHASGNVSGTAADGAGLTKNSAYSWQVRANCSTGTSDWATGAFNARINSQYSLIEDKEIFAFPNPTDQNYINISWDLPTETSLKAGIFDPNTKEAIDQAVSIQLIDINGKTVLNLKTVTGESNRQLDVTELMDGMYIIQITNNKGYTARLKFLKI